MRLVFDSSRPSVCVGLLSDSGEWILEKMIDEGVYQQSKVLFQMIKDLLAEHEVTSSEIQSIGVGIGPGSYTGLRVGLTLAKIWSFSKEIPLYSFSSDRLYSSDDKFLGLSGLSQEDFSLIENIDEIEPIYKNDLFGNKPSS